MLLLYHLCDDRGIDCKPIYIPLCFYFIFVRYPFPGYAVPFTFHYASTLSRTAITASDAGLNLHSTMLLLYQHRLWSRRRYFPHLHSTMLLLYPGRARGMAHPERYLHSTMLLLYLTHPAGLFLPVIPFTFHYASTLSDCARHCVMEFFIYIPLCFYFIEISEKYQNILKPIYIPLCFYFIISTSA